MTDTIDVAALVERLTNLVGTPIEEDLEYIQAADAAMTDAVNALTLQADTLAKLHDGRRAILPHTVEHAENLYTVAVAALRSFGRDPEASLATMREALEELVDTLTPASYPAMKDPAHHDEIKRLGDRIGYGALMAGASAAWREATPHKGSEFVAGPCYSVLKADYDRARRALGGSNAE